MKNHWAYLSEFTPTPDFSLLDRFVEELLRWNRAVRLVGPSDADGVAIQIADSLLPFHYEKPVFPLLDIGSGAGLPAIPLATVWKDSQVLCVEPRSKRVSFIRHAARSLGLMGVKAVCARAEEAITAEPSLARTFGTVTARAVADVETLLRLADPYLADGGRVILGRGADEIPIPKGWRLSAVHKYRGPTESGERSVAVFYKE